MAPLPLPEARFKPPSLPPSIKSAASVAVHQLSRLRVLVYILLGTSAIFGFGLMIWKLGSLFRQFTLGRVLRERKSVETRYIKTWYGWIPQDRYDSRKEKWRDLYSKCKDWFSWEESVDYSKIWWDSDHGGDQLRRKSRSGSFRARLRRTSLGKKKSKQIDVRSVITERENLPAYPAVTVYHILNRPSPAYLTYPLCLKTICPIAVRGQDFRFSQPKLDPALRRIFEWHNSYESRILKNDATPGRSPRSIRGKARKSTHLRMWATRLEMGSLQSILPHKSGTTGRPGSPLISVYGSSGSSQQTGFCNISLPQIPKLLETAVGVIESPRASSLVRPSPSISTETLHPASKETRPTTGNTSSKFRGDTQSKMIDIERRFAVTLNRHLEWLASECQPGQRGFKFPTLPKNWLNKEKRLVYTNPCSASIEYMRRYAHRRADENETISLRPAIQRRRVRAASIESWRAAINRARRDQNMSAVRSVEFFTSSTDDTPDTVIDPANWMLRRPPQGFEMPSRQKTSYWYGGTGEWAKLEEWQAIGDASGNFTDIRGGTVNACARSKETWMELLSNNAGIVCS